MEDYTQITRPLTSGEISILQSMYGGSTESWQHVTVANYTPSWVGGNVPGLTLGNNTSQTIYMSPNYYSDDFSTAPLPQQAILIHEGEHVEQYQAGVNVQVAGLFSSRIST